MLYVLNQKSHLTKEEQEKYTQEIRKLPRNPHVVFAPSTCYLPLYENLPLASQDISAYEMGAYTGEVSAESLKSLGVSYCIIGHSERRNYFHETNDVFQKKITQALRQGMTPIFCIGETEEEHESGRTKEILTKELSLLSFFPQELWKKIVIAYEPIWAIGTGKSIQKQELEAIVTWLKQQTNCLVLYGGSVQLETIESFQEIPHLDGFLIGGMSTDLVKVIQLIKDY